VSTTLERPIEDRSEQVATRVPAGQRPTIPLQDVARLTAALATAAAGVIHFAFAPAHLDESLSHGIFFLAAGWLQLGLALALVLRARPERLWLSLTGLVSVGIIATWVISRTTGVPGSDPEAVGFADVLATVLEIIAVLAVVAVLLDRLPRRSVPRGPLLGVGGVAVVASVALVSMAVSPSFSGHGHDEGSAAGHGHGDAAAAPDDWQQQRLEALTGSATPEQVEEFKQVEGEYLAAQIRERSELLAGLPEAEAQQRIDTYVDWAVNNTIALLEGAQASGTTMHTHGPVEWQTIDDPADQQALQDQLVASARVIEEFPTVADAEAGGYRQVSPFVPGIGAHWINFDLDRNFDPGRPEMLLYNGTNPTSRIVGLSYASIGDAPPEGFVGPNDVWHVHPGLCMLGGLVVGIDGTPEDLCTSIGGNINTQLGDMWMMHLWQVPSFESGWGLFSAENDKINVATSDIGRQIIAGDG